MTGITFTVIGKPQQKGSKQAFVNKRKDGSTFAGMKDTNPKARGWQDAVSSAAEREYRGRLLVGPVKLSVLFYFARPLLHMGTGRNQGRLKDSAPKYYYQQPDLDKLLRVLCDGLESVIIQNDKQICCYGDVEKRWTTRQARAEVTIEPLSEAEAQAIVSYRLLRGASPF